MTSAVAWLPGVTIQDKIQVLAIGSEQDRQEEAGWFGLPENVRIAASNFLEALRSREISHSLWWPGFPYGRETHSLHRIYVGKSWIQFGQRRRGGTAALKMEISTSIAKRLEKIPEWKAFCAIVKEEARKLS